MVVNKRYGGFLGLGESASLSANPGKRLLQTTHNIKKNLMKFMEIHHPLSL